MALSPTPAAGPGTTFKWEPIPLFLFYGSRVPGRTRGGKRTCELPRIDMNGSDVLRIVDAMHRDKNIPKEVIFKGIEDALQLAAQKYYGEEQEIAVTIDRASGEVQAKKGEEVLSIDPSLFGRIAAGSAKQVLIQKIREGESTAIMEEYTRQKGDLVNGTVQRFDGGAATVTLGRSESLLPRSEQIPGETHHVGERIKAVILDVRKVGHRVK